MNEAGKKSLKDVLNDTLSGALNKRPVPIVQSRYDDIMAFEKDQATRNPPLVVNGKNGLSEEDTAAIGQAVKDKRVILIDEFHMASTGVLDKYLDLLFASTPEATSAREGGALADAFLNGMPESGTCMKPLQLNKRTLLVGFQPMGVML